MALSTYRQLLRSARIAFADDAARLHAARAEARKGFEAGRALAPGSAELRSAIQHAQEVARILKENVVQGVRAGEGDRYRLRIHEHTQRRENSSVKAGCCNEM